jgi:hypothetical protein
MKITKEKYKESILILAKKYDLEKTYNLLIEENVSLPELTKYIIYDLFINEYNSYFEIEDVRYESWRNILDYTKELQENGFVNFK